jgi:hypothetical protein
MYVEEIETRNNCAGEGQQQLRTDRARSEKVVAEVWGTVREPKEERRPPLEAATKQQLVKTEKTLCVLWLPLSLPRVIQWDCRSYLQLRVLSVQ